MSGGKNVWSAGFKKVHVSSKSSVKEIEEQSALPAKLTRIPASDTGSVWKCHVDMKTTFHFLFSSKEFLFAIE